MSKSKKIYQKDDSEKYLVWACNHPDVVSGAMCCDGDCWNCSHHYQKDIRQPDPEPNNYVIDILNNLGDILCM